MNIWDELSAIGEAAPPGTWDTVPTDLSSRLSEAKQLYDTCIQSDGMKTKEINRFSIENSALRAENDSLMALAKFGRYILHLRDDEAAPFDPDLEDKAVELGLMAEVMASEPCGPECYCDNFHDFPTICLRLADKATVLDK